ncbi:sodium:proton antiporter [Sphingopyxis sp. JAI128]|uniref:cation:proton antiporter n=1 Tax=Sphingopyxis sp. JAI128 TaxID=2723066 RepID=UPI00160B5569|nr:cation:proton antiporter [Sphingopyxis sp. JAI128]MBB6425176.1 NhaP-type Na+/H+ or K+/H+ antiporter [Sphingopyxis sp. JAI128]
MKDQPFFDFSSYHLGMALVGAVMIAAFWLPRFLSGREPAASALLILFGIAIHWIFPGISQALDPRQAPLFWELASELAVIVALFGTGIRIDNVTDYRRWRPTIRLLAIAMPITIAAVAFMGFAFAGMTLAGALLLGAVLAPTDPVLAGEVQVGPPTEGGEHPVRFTLTTEAGLNDGLAFPFVYLGLLAGTTGFSAAMLGEWLLLDVLYRIAVGCAAGAAVGWVLGRVLFVIPRGNVLADTASGLLAIAGVLLCYGMTELAEGYGFIACFVAGVVLRRVEAEHAFHGQLHGFNEAIELALTALLLMLIGATFPRLFVELDWAHAAIALGLLFVVRPLAGWVSLLRTGLPQAERLVIAFYGVRGIGSIYYLGYAASHLELVNEGPLWATIALTILLSTMVHGFTAGPVVDHIVRHRQR